MKHFLPSSAILTAFTMQHYSSVDEYLTAQEQKSEAQQAAQAPTNHTKTKDDTESN
ncbi:hypothetical protein [Vibrio tritonius]|uniref:hypothetical protein n=1 Tax=Vibrio tritonius TaxID=1435069 RepID=UPI000B2FBE8E|nr:hypothetical protein [Vibrio tritonius]